MKLSLVVPCYNEEKNVSLFYEAVKKDFAGVDFDYELVLSMTAVKTALSGSLKSSVTVIYP